MKNFIFHRKGISFTEKIITQPHRQISSTTKYIQNISNYKIRNVTYITVNFCYIKSHLLLLINYQTN